MEELGFRGFNYYLMRESRLAQEGGGLSQDDLRGM